MRKLVAFAILVLVVTSMFGAVLTTTVLADENYNDYSQEHSDGPGVPPEDGMARDEPRTRFKDA